MHTHSAEVAREARSEHKAAGWIERLARRSQHLVNNRRHFSLDLIAYD